MVSKKEASLMIKYFPKCPICGAVAEYETSGILVKNYVQCKSCLAKWMSSVDFISGKEIKTLTLWETDKEGKSRFLLKKEKPVSFWQSLNLEKMVTLERETYRTPKGMNDLEYKACIDNLGLLDGEETKLQYVCFRQMMSPPSLWDGKTKMESKKGLLVFTNDNMIFMQQEGAWSSNYAQALRVPLEQIGGVVSGGTLIKHIRILVGVSGASERHEFINFVSTYGQQQIHEVRADIEKLLKEVREEKKRLALEAMAKGTVPAMIFCKFCGARNRADQSRCVNCGAPFT